MANPASRVLRTGGLYFNGVNNYVIVPHNNILNIAPGNKISILIWAKLMRWYGGSPVRVLIDKRTENTANYNWELTSTVMMMRVHAGGTIYIVNVPHSFDTWNFYAMVLDGSNLYGYLNGELKATVSNVATSGTNTANLRIGESCYALYRAKGIISEIRIYNRALSANEISEIYSKGTVIKDGLVLCLPFHEGEGNIAHDVSGYNNHGTIYGGANWVVKKALVR